MSKLPEFLTSQVPGPEHIKALEIAWEALDKIEANTQEFMTRDACTNAMQRIRAMQPEEKAIIDKKEN
jgi:hypothetical protein